MSLFPLATELQAPCQKWRFGCPGYLLDVKNRILFLIHGHTFDFANHQSWDSVLYRMRALLHTAHEMVYVSDQYRLSVKRHGATIIIPFLERAIPVPIAAVMRNLLSLVLIVLSGFSVFSQTKAPGYQSQEVSEVDGVPVLIKHLPDWESVKDQAKITNSIEELRSEFRNPSVLAGIDLDGGAEAAYASYGDSRLLLIEYPTPQGSSSADAAIQSAMGGSAGVVYKRIGNYNALVFGSSDPAAAEALLGKIEYGKTVQWLGEDPFYLQKFERYIANTGRDVAISTVLFILGIFVTAILLGVGTGYMYFRFRENERAHRTAYSDAGGLTRLNLDELSD